MPFNERSSRNPLSLSCGSVQCIRIEDDDSAIATSAAAGAVAPCTCTAAENSDVFPSASVAVAVTQLPTGIARVETEKTLKPLGVAEAR